MSVIGDRLREERESLRMSQAAFGEIGGVKANAQGKYESGERFPGADYLAAVAAAGVDVLYVLTGTRTPLPVAGLSPLEEKVLVNYRCLPANDKETIERITTALAESAAKYEVKKT